ncbi:MAG: diadenylate cyclase, partial [Bacteroidales bacterium]
TDLGLRHRSAIGSTLLTDAIAIIVSEQTGQISLCKEGHITRDISPTALKQMLINELTGNGE